MHHDIENQVCADIKARQANGLSKYGVSVSNNPLELKEWLQHAYTEALDLAIYLKRSIREIENRKLIEDSQREFPQKEQP